MRKITYIFLHKTYYNMLEKKKLQKLKDKKKFIITRLKELDLFPYDLTLMNEDQKVIYEQLQNFDFSYWEEVKEQRGWIPNKKSDEERRIINKKSYIRDYFRQKGVLPKYGEPLNEEEQAILDQIEAGDFSYHEQYVKNALENQKYNNLSTASLRNKRNRVKSELRKHGKLPTNYEELTEEQKEIINQIDNDDFTYYEEFIKNKPDATAENSKPKMVLHRLRLVEILPPMGTELNEIQQSIVDDVNENWEGKKKSHFITKYLEYSTPRGRLYYRAYKAHRDFGYNFNLELSDIIIPDVCPYLGIPLSTDPKDKDEDNYYTNDRKDSSKGYVKGNHQVISLKANRMKNKATDAQLLRFAVNGLTLLNKFEENAK